MMLEMLSGLAHPSRDPEDRKRAQKVLDGIKPFDRYERVKNAVMFHMKTEVASYMFYDGGRGRPKV